VSMPGAETGLAGWCDAGRAHAQVCALQWSRHEREILSSHGFSQNQLCLWRYPSMAKVAEMSGHTSRVLHLAQSPDGTAVCSAAADETLRFWKCFAEAAPATKARARPARRAGRPAALRASGVRRLLGVFAAPRPLTPSARVLPCSAGRSILPGRHHDSQLATRARPHTQPAEPG